MRIAIILLVLALAVSVVFNLIQRERAQRFEGSKYERSYDLPRNLIITRLISDGRLLHVEYDRNDDLEIDSIVHYDKDSRIVDISVDEDFDGIFELNWGYVPGQELTYRWEDLGQDGVFEEAIRFRPDSLFLYRDRNLDGWLDPDELVRSEKR